MTGTAIMTQTYTHVDLDRSIEIPADGILSRTIYSDSTVNVVMFGFDTGQELSEHTAARPAILHILRGEARLTFGGDTVEGHPGTWVRMPAGLAHSVYALTPLVMQLVLLPNE
ncbi:MAG: cupin domain-containing protein [Chloroflexota bacterium]